MSFASSPRLAPRYPRFCQQLGVNYQTLKSRARREAWRITETFGRAKPYPDKSRQTPQETFQLVRKSAKDILENNGVASRIYLSGAIRKASAHLEGMEEDKLIEKHQALNSLAKSAATVHSWDEPGQEHRMSLNVWVLSLEPEQLFCSYRDRVTADSMRLQVVSA